MMRLSIADIQSLSPDEFERLIAQMLRRQGFQNVLHLGGSGDEGVDIRAEWLLGLPTGDVRTTLWAIQCKRYSRPISAGQVRRILDAVVEPSPDFFPVSPDFFLIATSSSLTNQAMSVIERANKQPARYGCRFLVWDADKILEVLSDHPEIASTFSRTPADQEGTESIDSARLTVIFDQTGEEVILTFVYGDLTQRPTTLMAKTRVTEPYFERIKQQCQTLVAQTPLPAYSKENEILLKVVGRLVNDLIPEAIQDLLWAGKGGYIRLESNIHIIPFELAYLPRKEMFLGSLYRIGRIPLAETLAHQPQWHDTSMLIVGDIKPDLASGIHLSELPFSQAEADTIAKLLAEKGISVRTLVGSDTTMENVYKALTDHDFQIIHFAGHGFEAPSGRPGIVLADQVAEYERLFPLQLPSSLVVLSACSSGLVLNKLSEQLFDRGAIGLIGFVGPVSDEAARDLTVAFYQVLAQGATLGDALYQAREAQQERHPRDYSWASFVLFGDPTIRVM